MKKTILSITVFSMLFSSCVTGSKSISGMEGVNSNTCTILPEQTSRSRTNKIWILFFPFGGKSEEKREAQCFNKMIKDNKADGIAGQKYVSKKITIPLIVVTYSFKYTTLTGKPYIIKMDSLKTTK